jgi:hypothetical protein
MLKAICLFVGCAIVSFLQRSRLCVERAVPTAARFTPTTHRAMAARMLLQKGFKANTVSRRMLSLAQNQLFDIDREYGKLLKSDDWWVCFI